MRLYLIRHGESVANRDHLAAGWGAFPLTEKGQEQARRVGEQLRRLPPFDKIYVSDLVRTRQTFECAFGAETEHTLSPLLREVNAPFAGEPFAENFVRRGEAYRTAVQTMNYGAFGGESAAELTARVKAFREQLEAEQLERVAAVTHAGFIRAFLALTMGVSAADVRPFTGNCSVSVFEYVPADRLWRLRRYNWSAELD